MQRVNLASLIVLAVVAFFASSIWYSPLLFGREFLALSGTTAGAHPIPVKAILELFRTFVLALVVARLLIGLKITDWKAALGLGLWLWIGFPVILLTGSVLWQSVPWRLATIHAGDWLVKLTLIPVGLVVWPKRSAVKPVHHVQRG
jgi:Protein of unknown function (DUF1761)